MSVASDLLNVTRLENRWHGITLKPSSDEGVVIQAVEKNSPAEQAGLKPGDVLHAIEHRPLSRQLDLERILLGRKNNEPIELKVKRQAEFVETKLALAAKPKTVEDNDKHWQVLGLKLAQMPAQQFKQGTSRYRGGLQVLNVRPDSPAAKQGFARVIFLLACTFGKQSRSTTWTTSSAVKTSKNSPQSSSYCFATARHCSDISL